MCGARTGRKDHLDELPLHVAHCSAHVVAVCPELPLHLHGRDNEHVEPGHESHQAVHRSLQRSTNTSYSEVHVARDARVCAYLLSTWEDVIPVQHNIHIVHLSRAGLLEEVLQCLTV